MNSLDSFPLRPLLDRLSRFTDRELDDFAQSITIAADASVVIGTPGHLGACVVELLEGARGRVLVAGADPVLCAFVRQFAELEVDAVSLDDAPAVGRLMVSFPEFFGGIPVRLDIEHHRDRYERVPLPFDDDSFSALICHHMLELMDQDPIPFLLECSRVLEPDGVLVIAVPNAVSVENVSRVLTGVSCFDGYPQASERSRRSREYTMSEVRTILDRLGFVYERSFTSDVAPNLAIAVHRVANALRIRERDLGQWVFVKARRGHEPAEAGSWDEVFDADRRDDEPEDGTGERGRRSVMERVSERQGHVDSNANSD